VNIVKYQLALLFTRDT